MNNITGRVNIDRAKLENHSAHILVREMRTVLRQIVAQAKQNAPVRTGNLRRSIHEGPIHVDGPFHVTGSVIADAEYAAAVHEGTPRRTITAKNAEALRFTVGGKTLFRKEVEIPPRKPRPFLQNAAEQVAKRHT